MTEHDIQDAMNESLVEGDYAFSEFNELAPEIPSVTNDKNDIYFSILIEHLQKAISNSAKVCHNHTDTAIVLKFKMLLAYYRWCLENAIDINDALMERDSCHEDFSDTLFEANDENPDPLEEDVTPIRIRRIISKYEDAVASLNEYLDIENNWTTLYGNLEESILATLTFARHFDLKEFVEKDIILDEEIPALTPEAVVLRSPRTEKNMESRDRIFSEIGIAHPH